MFGNVVRTLRKERKWSRARLAEVSGVSENTIERLELGQGDISLGKARAIAKGLGFSLGELLTIAEDEAERCGDSE